MKVWILLATCIAIQIVQCWSCDHRGVECIDYEVMNRHMGYEERQYPSLRWISVTETGPSLSRAQISMYKKLFRYIQGDNLRGEFINSTTPIRTRVNPCKKDSSPTCEPSYTMSMKMPQEMQEVFYPLPTNVDLFFEKEPPTRYVVRSFGGRPSEAQWMAEAHKLAELTLKEQSLVQSHYYLNWYDPPLQLFNRLNEVWITKYDNKKYLLPHLGTEDNEVC